MARHEKRVGRRRRTAGVILLSILAETLFASGAFIGLYALWDVWWNERVATAEATRVAAELSDAWQANPEGNGQPGVGEPPIGTDWSTLQDGAIGLLHIPRFGEGWARAVYEGTTRAKTLNPLGIGRYKTAAAPGGIGNFSLAGHRTTYSKPFNQIHTIEIGDALVFESQDTWYVYKVTVAHKVITPWQNEVLAPVFGDKTWEQEPTERTITLTACHPMYSRKQRYVVHGTLDYWMPKTNGVPEEIK